MAKTYGDLVPGDALLNVHTGQFMLVIATSTAHAGNWKYITWMSSSFRKRHIFTADYILHDVINQAAYIVMSGCGVHD